MKRTPSPSRRQAGAMDPKQLRTNKVSAPPSNDRFPSTATTRSSCLWEDFSDSRRKTGKSACNYRIGPAPIEDCTGEDMTSVSMGTLDSDVEDESNADKSAAGSRALIIYFSKIAKRTNVDTIDYRFLDALLKSGARVDACDSHGQTVMFEVVRNWHVDVAKFFVHHGADMNHRDKMGRTPLHLASACDHHEMVEYMLLNGGDMHAKTTGEEQSPIHYAAKYNAVLSLKVLLEKKANINSHDYKRRTPLFLAAEMGQEDSARYLVDFGAPVGVFDDSGMSAIGCMVEKMPNVALDAYNQFMEKNTSFRKDSFYLNYLEYDPRKWMRDEEIRNRNPLNIDAEEEKERKRLAKREKLFQCPTTALQLAVQLEEFDIIVHPVNQELIKQKWKAYGQFWAVMNAIIHFIYIMLWTVEGALGLEKEDMFKGKISRIALTIVAVLLTFYFILKQVWERRIAYRENQNIMSWRKRQIDRDMKFCHSRWPLEKTFLETELRAVYSGQKSFLSDPWNVLDLITYMGVVFMIVVHIVYMVTKKDIARELHEKAFPFLLIVMWLDFMKSCRPFMTLGPFITMLGHVIIDTGRFAFLFFEFFIPYAVGFWILFGGPGHAKEIEKAGKDSIDWKQFNDLLFSVWQVTLNVGFNMEALEAVDRLFAQIMVGTFFALSTVVCLNLYIALLSETFNIVYQNAKANASLLQAMTIFQIEKVLPKTKKREVRRLFQENFGPLETSQEEDVAGITEEELWDQTIRRVVTRLSTMQDFVVEKISPKKVVNQKELMKRQYEEQKENYDLYQLLLRRDQEIYQMQMDVYELKCAALTCLGERILPPPQFKPIPVLDIKKPTPLPESIIEKKKIEEKKKMMRDNVVFEQILKDKLSKSQSSLVDEDVELSGSWLNIADESHC